MFIVRSGDGIQNKVSCYGEALAHLIDHFLIKVRFAFASVPYAATAWSVNSERTAFERRFIVEGRYGMMGMCHRGCR